MIRLHFQAPNGYPLVLVEATNATTEGAARARPSSVAERKDKHPMTNSLSSPTAAKLLADHRAANPRSRAISLIRLVRNGGSTKQYGCVLCGAHGPTFAAKWRETKTSRDWCLAHVAKHVAATEFEARLVVPGANSAADTAIECALVALARIFSGGNC